MKTLFSTVLTLFIAMAMIAQDSGTEIQLSNGKTILLGSIPEEALQKAPYSHWYTANYTQYTPDFSSIAQFREELKKYRILIFMGTWCGDSKRETPRFFKIMDAAGVKEKQLTLITMNRSKKTPDNLEEGLNITNVPTFIFYKDGKEINRIVEYPIESLEKDMIAILNGEPYKHTYAE